MLDKKYTVSHAPFWHDGDGIQIMNRQIMLAALPAVLFGILKFGMIALGVIALSISTAMIWEILFKKIADRPIAVGDLSAAVIGLMFGMMLPPTVPWWLVVTGTFISIVIGREIFGGIGGNPFNPAVVGIAILMLSWKNYFDFDIAFLNFDLPYKALAPLAALKHQGPGVVDLFKLSDLLMGNQIGAIGATFGLGVILGGIYLIIRGYIRWEISCGYIAGIIITAILFKMVDPVHYAGPMFHLCTGYTLLGAFFLATESSSSPVNFVPMIIYGCLGGFLIILIRNIGAYPDGTLLAILFINLMNPLIDKIRPKTLGGGVNNA